MTMATAKMTVARAALVGPMCAWAACSNPVDSAANELPWLSEREVVDEVEVTPEEVSPVGCDDCLTVGRWYRFDTLALTTIDGKEHPVIETLNGLWAADITDNQLDIMLEVTAVSATELQARVMNGARIDGTDDICKLPSTSVELVFPRSGCRLERSNESPFNVYAGTETYPKNCTTTLPVHHAIPVSRAQLEGTFSEDCGRIIAGKVPSGGLGQLELGETCTCLTLGGKPASDCAPLDASYVNDNGKCDGCNANYKELGQLLEAFGTVDWLCKTEDDRPAACLTADFTAVAMTGAPPDCEP